jgi:hypothetical protein
MTCSSDSIIHFTVSADNEAGSISVQTMLLVSMKVLDIVICRTNCLNMMKFSQAISWVSWLSSEKTIVLKTISVLVLRVLIIIRLSHNQTSTLRTRSEMVFEMLVFSLLNQLTWPIAQENIIILSHRESNKSH